MPTPARRPNRMRPKQITAATAARGPAGTTTPSVEKSLPAGLTGNLNGGIRDMSTAVAAAQLQSLGVQVPMPRDQFPYAFGPGTPLLPAPLDPTRPDTGRAEPRIYEYPVSWNIPGVNHRMVPWQVLRQASNVGVIRDCIRIRKNEITSLEWDITLTQDAVEAAQRKDPGKARADIEQDLQKELADVRQRVTAFWKKPDKGNGYGFGDWMTEALEEHLVLDALAIYPRFTYGGELYSLEILDGSTIKPLLDHRGGRPLPPFPAYQQILYGFPRGEFVADTDESDDGVVLTGGYDADQLIYKRREVRTHSPYGLSAVEQSLTDVDLWLKRAQWMRAEYTEGVMPAGWLKNAGDSNWNPAQLLEYERDLNDVYSGNTAMRHRLRVLPPGVEPVEGQRGIEEKYKPDYDLHLLKLVVAHFDMSIAELGFTEAKGLGSSGYHEGQENVQERKQTRPDLQWMAGIITDISRVHLAMPEELEFKWLGLDQEDEAGADELNRSRVASAGMTLNEWRDVLGRPRYDFPEADMPMIVSTRGGIVYLDGASELEPAGVVIEPPQAPPGAQGAPGGVPPAEGEPGDGEERTSDDAPSEDDAKTTEKAAYANWLRKGARGRAFQWYHHTAVEAAQIEGIFKAGGADPKVRSVREWPGWTKDLAAAKVWAGRLSEGLTGAISTRSIAEAWLTARKAAPIMPTADASAWLGSQGVTVNATMRGIIRDIYCDGWVIGDRSALAMVTDTTADWGAWTPGDTEAALAILAGDQSLENLLAASDVTINSIAAGRMDQLAMTLAQALENGDSVDTLASALADVLDDQKWAYMVATTELNRAMSSATLATYGRNGIEASYWLTAYDERVCPLCGGNEDVEVPLNQNFPSGNYQPPAHPLCRCALAPVIASLSDVDTSGMSLADLEATS